MLKRLAITNIRNIASAQLPSLQPCNIIYGANGSGKTSVLESLNLVSVGRSFRSQRIQPVIRRGAEDCTVFTELDRGGSSHAIGVRRDLKAKYEVRVDGESLSTVAALADYVPTQLVYSDSFLLLTGGPKLRRQFLDWGVFHVEQQFHTVWQLVQRCIKQRNSLLRRGKIAAGQLEPWEVELCNLSEQINPWRLAVFQQLVNEFQTVLKSIAPNLQSIELLYHPGWDESIGITESLAKYRERDCRNGYTGVGPHRASFSLFIEQQEIQHVLSRGAAQSRIVCLKTGPGPVVITTNRKILCVFVG